LNSEKIKPVALAIVELRESEGIINAVLTVWLLMMLIVCGN